MQDYQHRHKRTQTTCISLLSFSGSQKVLYFRGFFRAFTNFGSDKYYRTALEYVDVSIYVSLTGYNKACKDRVTFLWENCINQKSLPTYTDSENKVHVSPFIYNSRSFKHKKTSLFLTVEKTSSFSEISTGRSRKFKQDATPATSERYKKPKTSVQPCILHFLLYLSNLSNRY